VARQNEEFYIDATAKARRMKDRPMRDRRNGQCEDDLKWFEKAGEPTPKGIQLVAEDARRT
jgi:hypothetical protein